MIRANNQSATVALISQLHPPLKQILLYQYLTIALILLLTALKSIFPSVYPLRIFPILWIMGDSVLAGAYRLLLSGLRVDNPVELLADGRWLKRRRDQILAFGYTKFLCMLLNMLGIMQMISFVSLPTLVFFLLSLSQIPLSLLTLTKASQVKLLFQKINRIFNNFDIDFEEEKEEYLNQRSIQDQKGHCNT